ncbi:hypothetical protein BC940DRAFT_25515 [Gongronella butleri]|nr:hypothetical protein BC940DRAFT_25515 [Gongronella butleri]
MKPISFVKGHATDSAGNQACEAHHDNDIIVHSPTQPPARGLDSLTGDQACDLYASIVMASSSASPRATTTPKEGKTLSSTPFEATEQPQALAASGASSVRASSAPPTSYCESCAMEVIDPAHYQGMAHLVGRQQQLKDEEARQKRRIGSNDVENDENTDQGPDVLVSRLQLEHGQTKALTWMRQQGWRDGAGLGRENQGMRHPVVTTFKQDRLGLGHPQTDRRKVTHPSIAKHTGPQPNNPMTNTNSGKSIAAQAKVDAAKRQAMLQYLKQ